MAGRKSPAMRIRLLRHHGSGGETTAYGTVDPANCGANTCPDRAADDETNASTRTSTRQAASDCTTNHGGITATIASSNGHQIFIADLSHTGSSVPAVITWQAHSRQ